MIAILGGLAAATSWAIATLCSSRSSRMVGPASVLSWVMIIGFLVSIPPSVLAIPGSTPLSLPQMVGLVVNGFSYTAGLLLVYRALTIGRVSIVTPIAATEGALAAIGSVLLGEPLGLPMAIVLAAIVTGIILSAIDRRAEDDTRHEDPAVTRRSIILAIAGAGAFSIGLITSARLGTDVPISWIILVSRAVGCLVIALPLALRGDLRLSRRALPLVVVSGILEAVGNAFYVFGAQSSPATAAVLSSQFAAIAAVSAFIFFHERLQRIQVVGVSVIALGVTALAIVRS